MPTETERIKGEAVLSLKRNSPGVAAAGDRQHEGAEQRQCAGRERS